MLQQARYKRQYDKKHKVVNSAEFAEGDLVQFLNGRKLSRKGEKMTGTFLLVYRFDSLKFMTWLG